MKNSQEKPICTGCLCQKLNGKRQTACDKPADTFAVVGKFFWLHCECPDKSQTIADQYHRSWVRRQITFYEKKTLDRNLVAVTNERREFKYRGYSMNKRYLW